MTRSIFMVVLVLVASCALASEAGSHHSMRLISSCGEPGTNPIVRSTVKVEADGGSSSLRWCDAGSGFLSIFQRLKGEGEGSSLVAPLLLGSGPSIDLRIDSVKSEEMKLSTGKAIATSFVIRGRYEIGEGIGPEGVIAAGGTRKSSVEGEGASLSSAETGDPIAGWMILERLDTISPWSVEYSSRVREGRMELAWVMMP